jgi:hypothetical protein
MVISYSSNISRQAGQPTLRRRPHTGATVETLSPGSERCLLPSTYLGDPREDDRRLQRGDPNADLPVQRHRTRRHALTQAQE